MKNLSRGRCAALAALVTLSLGAAATANAAIGGPRHSTHRSTSTAAPTLTSSTTSTTWHRHRTHPAPTTSPTPQPSAPATPAPTPTPTPTPPASSAAPTPTVTPTPTPTVKPTTAPSAFPDASNTGVPAGTALKPSGSLTVTTNGAVIDGLDISGALVIKAANVTVKNTRIVSGSDFWVVTNQGSGTKFDHVTVAGKGTASTVTGQSGIVGGQGTYNAVDVSGVENGFVPGNGSVIQNSYVHGLAAPGSPHYDGIQIDGNVNNVKITGSTIINNQTQTSAVMVDNGDGPATNIVVDGNRLIGGGYTVYADGQFSTSSSVNVSYTNNRIGKGYYGYGLVRQSSVTWSNNVDDKTGSAVSAG